jgi:hypothetical protein
LEALRPRNTRRLLHHFAVSSIKISSTRCFNWKTRRWRTAYVHFLFHCSSNPATIPRATQPAARWQCRPPPRFRRGLPTASRTRPPRPIACLRPRRRHAPPPTGARAGAWKLFPEPLRPFRRLPARVALTASPAASWTATAASAAARCTSLATPATRAAPERASPARWPSHRRWPGPPSAAP